MVSVIISFMLIPLDYQEPLKDFDCSCFVGRVLGPRDGRLVSLCHTEYSSDILLVDESCYALLLHLSPGSARPGRSPPTSKLISLAPGHQLGKGPGRPSEGLFAPASKYSNDGDWGPWLLRE